MNTDNELNLFENQILNVKSIEKYENVYQSFLTIYKNEMKNNCNNNNELTNSQLPIKFYLIPCIQCCDIYLPITFNETIKQFYLLNQNFNQKEMKSNKSHFSFGEFCTFINYLKSIELKDYYFNNSNTNLTTSGISHSSNNESFNNNKYLNRKQFNEFCLKFFA
jgi:hypothetical protein